MAASVRIAVQGADRVGLVAAVTGCLFSFGLDLGDTTFAVLGAGFEFAAVAECPSGVSAAQVKAELRSLPDLADCQVMVEDFAFDAPPGDRGRGTHRIRIRGGDQPGLIARLSEAFIEFGANIVRMSSERVRSSGDDLYVTEFEVAVPAERAPACLAAVASTAEQLHQVCVSETL